MHARNLCRVAILAVAVTLGVGSAATSLAIPDDEGSYLETAIADGTRSESAHLATIVLPVQDDSLSANSDDRIAIALFGVE